jgi:hypothetical protein
MKTNLVAADCEWAWEFVSKRAAKAGRRVSHVDFIAGAPVEDWVVSKTSPQKRTTDDKYLAVLQSALSEFKRIVIGGRARSDTRLVFWNTASTGLYLRNDKRVAHVWLSITTASRSYCWLCGRRGGQSTVHECGLCGERVCNDCKPWFHSNEVLERKGIMEHERSLSTPPVSSGASQPASASSADISTSTPVSGSESIAFPQASTASSSASSADSTPQSMLVVTPQGPKSKRIRRSSAQL